MNTVIERIDAEWNQDLTFPGTIAYEKDSTSTNSFGIQVEESVAYVTFRGTYTFQTILEDLWLWPLIRDGVFRFHPGFYLAYVSLRDQLLPILNKLKIKSIVLNGHSLGAAIACICGHDLLMLGFSVSEINLLACPRFGNKAVVRFLSDTTKVNCFINGNDAIWYVSPFLSRPKYQRIGKPIWWKLFSFKDHLLGSSKKNIGYKEAFRAICP